MTIKLHHYQAFSVNQASPIITEQSSGGPATGGEPLALWIIVIAGAILRLIALGQHSFWLDEIASVAIARRPWPVFWHFLWHDEGNMALYYVLLKPWLHLGYGEATVRLLSAIPGIASIPLMYVLGARLFGNTIGLLSATFLALNTCAIAVSQEARAYSFAVLLVLLSTYLFARLIDGSLRDGVPAPSFPPAVAYGFVAGLTCYFHYFGVLVPAAHAASVLAVPAKQRPWKPLAPAWAIIAVFASPILWLIHAQDVGHISWLQPPSWLELYHLGVFLAAGGGKVVGAILLGLELALAVFFVAILLKVWRGGDEGRLHWHYALVASAVVTPVVITLLASLVRPAFYHRFLIICLPGWLLMVAVGVAHLPSRLWRGAAIVCICGLSLVATVHLDTHETEDWRAVVRYLLAHTRPADRILYYQSVGEFAGESYRDWLQSPNAPRPSATGIDPARPGWQREIGHAPRVWLVLYRTTLDAAGSSAIEQELSKTYVNRGVLFFSGITAVEYEAR